MLQMNLIELIAITIESIENQLKGWPPYEHNWRERYRGNQKLPAYTVELNTFKMTVDHVVGNIMYLVEESITNKGQPEVKDG